MRAASLLAMAVASLPKELQGKVLFVDDFAPQSAPKNIALPFTEEWGTDPLPRLSPTVAPTHTKGKASHKQQARKQKRSSSK